MSTVVVSAGTPPALIQRENYDEEFAATAFWINLALASACSWSALVSTARSWDETLRIGAFRSAM
jgi:hypothetical protein